MSAQPDNTGPFIVMIDRAWDDCDPVMEETRTFPTAEAARAYIAVEVTWADVLEIRCPALGIQVAGEYKEEDDLEE